MRDCRATTQERRRSQSRARRGSAPAAAAPVGALDQPMAEQPIREEPLIGRAGAEDWWHPRAVIVHPRFAHTLGDPAVAAEAPALADWRHLPPELVEAVAGHLDSARDLLNLSAVCRDARPLAGNERLWRHLCRRRFGVPAEEPPAGEADDFWMRLYQFNHRTFVSISRTGSGAGLGGAGPGGGARLFMGGSGPLMVINL